MKTIVLDRHSIARAFWLRTCTQHGIEFEIASEYSASVRDSLRSDASILVVDQSVGVGDFHGLLRQVVSENPASAVMATGSGFTVSLAMELIKNGIAWVLCKELTSEHVEAALPFVMQKARVGHESFIEHGFLAQLFAEISQREFNVLKMVLRGIPNKMIASQLNVSIRTVEARRAKVYRKLHANTLPDLVHSVDRARALQDRFGSLGFGSFSLDGDDDSPTEMDSMDSSERLRIKPQLRLA